MPRHHHPNGMVRRELLQIGFLGAAGLSLAGVAEARAGQSGSAPRSPVPQATARSVILVWLPGGPPQMGLWDLKPDSPAQCRGGATGIRTSAPGVEIGSRLPLTARQMRHCCIVRTMTMQAEDFNHNAGQHMMLAGLDAPPAGATLFASRSDWPSIGALAARVLPNRSGLPTAVHVPARVRGAGEPIPGETAGWLGGRYDPWLVEGDPNRPDFRVPDLAPLPGLTVERAANRRRLLAQVDDVRRDLEGDLVGRSLAGAQARAFGLLLAPETRGAFDLAQEPAKLRDRYGRHTWGQSLLLARRLAQAGVKFVQVNLVDGAGVNTWDYHSGEPAGLDRHAPPFDQGFSALVEDLHDQGMLSDTLLVCASEMGRHPVMGKTPPGVDAGLAAPDGRNHWQQCWSAVFAGAGVRGGTVVGQSDAWAAYPEGEAYTPADFVATLLAAIGVPQGVTVRDLQDRPLAVNEGRPIAGLYAGRG